MTSELYSRKMELRLIENFQREFYSKLGYFPYVIAKSAMEEYQRFKPFMTLEELGQRFNPFLPIVSGQKIRLQTRTRKREIVELRHIFTFIAKTMGYSYSSIAYYLGKKDHSTMIHSMKTFDDMYQTSDNFRQKFETIHQYINSDINIKYDPSTMDHPYQTQGESQPPVLPGLL